MTLVGARELRCGDVITVKQMVQSGVLVREEWVPAQIVTIGTHGDVCVRFMRGRRKVLWLSHDDRGTTWKG